MTFGFEARSDDGGIEARCTVVDRDRRTKVKCLDASEFEQTGTHATFSGNAVVNGTPTRYTIDVDDFAEPGRGADTFRIITGLGFETAGLLTQGNIQVHRQ